MVKLSAATLMLLSVFGLNRCTPEPIDEKKVEAFYETPLSRPEGPLAVFHIGHSLVSRDMPAMLAQLAGGGHSHKAQLGWGSTMRQHWEPDVPVTGHEVENAHPRHRDAREAVDSGDYDILILTEGVEIRDSIKYHNSWDYLARWAKAARAANPDIRVYFYETWHETNDPEGWLTRIDKDLNRYWEREILDRAMSVEGAGTIYVIPAGQVFARFLREAEARGGVGGINDVADLFSDTIHPNHLGLYLVALTHYAVIYGKSPEGLPHELKLHTGEPATAPSREAAELMQKVVWDVVTAYPRTGLEQKASTR